MSLKQPQDPAAEFRRRMKENYKIEVSEAEEISVINNLEFRLSDAKGQRDAGGAVHGAVFRRPGGACRRLSKK